MSSVLYRDAALTDARSDRLSLGVSILVTEGRIAWIRPAAGGEGELPADCEVVDASGATIVPGMVDGHSHLTLPGGSHWIDRGSDPTDRLLAVAEANGELQYRSGVRWARDVGAPRRAAPPDAAPKALTLGIRDRWQRLREQGRRDRPYVRAAGTWVTAAGLLPPGLTVEARDGDELLAGALGQLDDGADFVKLYLDGPDADTPPFTASEVTRVVQAVHARGRKLTAHATRLPGTRVCAAAGVDSIEHGFELDADIAAEMAERGCALVTTMTVLKSWLTFGTTTTMPRFTQGAARDHRDPGNRDDQRPAGPGGRGGHRRRHRLRRRFGPGQPAALGDRVPGPGGPGALAGAGQRHLARRRAARRAGRRPGPRGRPG